MSFRRKTFFAAISSVLISAQAFSDSSVPLSKVDLDKVAKAAGCKSPRARGAEKVDFFSKDTVIFACATEKKDTFRLFVIDPKNDCGSSFLVDAFDAYTVIRPGSRENKEEALRNYIYEAGKPYREGDSHLPIQEPILRICHDDGCTTAEYWVCHKKRWLSSDRC
jgi:hypothetical protein